MKVFRMLQGRLKGVSLWFELSRDLGRVQTSKNISDYRLNLYFIFYCVTVVLTYFKEVIRVTLASVDVKTVK